MKGKKSMKRYYQPEIETASREQIREWQSERLVKQVQNVWDNVPMYRKRMEEKGLTPDDIKSVDDLHKLPFIEKDDLRDEYPYGLLDKVLYYYTVRSNSHSLNGRSSASPRKQVMYACVCAFMSPGIASLFVPSMTLSKRR